MEKKGQLLLDNGENIISRDILFTDEGNKYGKVISFNNEEELLNKFNVYLSNTTITSIGNKKEKKGHYMVIDGNTSLILQLVNKPCYSNIIKSILDKYNSDKSNFLNDNNDIKIYNIYTDEELMYYNKNNDSINMSINKELEEKFIKEFILSKCNFVGENFDMITSDDYFIVLCGDYSFKFSSDLKEIVDEVYNTIYTKMAMASFSTMFLKK